MIAFGELEQFDDHAKNGKYSVAKEYRRVVPLLTAEVRLQYGIVYALDERIELLDMQSDADIDGLVEIAVRISQRFQTDVTSVFSRIANLWLSTRGQASRLEGELKDLVEAIEHEKDMDTYYEESYGTDDEEEALHLLDNSKDMVFAAIIAAKKTLREPVSLLDNDFKTARVGVLKGCLDLIDVKRDPQGDLFKDGYESGKQFAVNVIKGAIAAATESGEEQ